MSLELYLAYVVACIALALLPGPNVTLLIANGLRHGTRAAMICLAGTQVGLAIVIAIVGAGLTTLMATMGYWFDWVRLAGAAYLIWLGIGMIRAKLAAGEVNVAPAKTVRRALIDSFLVEVLNPKVALFFIALLPQFVDPAGSLPVWAQFLILGTIVNIAFSSADLLTVLSASLVVKTMKRTQGGFAVGRWLGGSLMIGLGVKLATDKG